MFYPGRHNGAIMESMDFELVETDVCVPMDVDAVPEYVILSQIQSIRSGPQERVPPVLSHSTALPARSKHKTHTLYLVLDTNVLLGHLNFITELRDSVVSGLQPTLVLPWVVIQELDGLKENEMVGRQAHKAVKFIHACVADGHPRVRVQRSDEERSGKELRIECNDDRILECCLYFQTVVFGERNGSKKGMVALFTNDVNLSVKSMVHNIPTFSRQTIVNGLKHVKTETPRNSQTSPNEESFEPVAKKPCLQTSQKSSHDNRPRHSSETGSGSFTVGVKRKRPHSFPKSTPSREIPTTLQKVASTVNTSLPPNSSDDSIYCQASAVLRDALSCCIEEHMVKIYEELWMTIVAVKPPWTLRDCLFLLNKHWVAVFGFILPRYAQKWVEILQDLVKKADSKCLNSVQAKCFVETSREIIGMFVKEASHPEKIKEFDSKLAVLV